MKVKSTLTQIAEKADVSIATVSRILNDTGRVSPATRQKVIQAIRELEQTSGRQVFVAVEPFKTFYAAEEYHQDYYRKNPEAFRKELVESGRIKL